MSYRACRKGSEEHVAQGLNKCLINTTCYCQRRVPFTESSERLGDVPKVTQLVSGSVKSK